MDSKRVKTSPVHAWDNLSELAAVRVFVAVAEFRSFRGAALALGVPRSTVSRKLAQLEEQLGERLLQRTTRVVSLTEAGAAYLDRVAPALSTITEAGRSLHDAHATPRGVLKVTAPPDLVVLLLAEVMTGFLFEYPEVRIEVESTLRFVDLVAEGYDVAFRFGPLPDSTLVARRLYTTIARCYASPAYLEAHGWPKTPADLAAHDCIVFSVWGAVWPFAAGEREVEVRVRGRLASNSLVVACNVALAGLGIVRLPEVLAKPYLRDGRLVEVLSDFVTQTIPLHLLYPSGRHLSPRVRAFVDYVAARLTTP